MVGIIGSINEVSETLREGLHVEKWYQENQKRIGNYNLLNLSHGEKDETGNTVLDENELIGFIRGHAYDIKRPEMDPKSVLRETWSDPEETLPHLEGSFLIVLSDGNQLIIAVDRLASKPCYYTSNPKFTFCSELKGFPPLLSSPQLDTRAINDLLMFDFIWGEKTLLDGVRSLPPQSYLKYSDSEISLQRYATIEMGEKVKENYIENVYKQYQSHLEKIVETVPDGNKVSMWLSGGLDSRFMLSLLASIRPDLHTYTYDANPGKRANIEPAKQSASVAGVENQLCQFNVNEFIDVLVEGVQLGDGMRSWLHYHNLPHIINDLATETDILFDGNGQGSFFGEDMFSEALNTDLSPSEVLLRYFSLECISSEIHRSLIKDDVSAADSVRDATQTQPEDSNRDALIRSLYANFCPNFYYRNGIVEQKVGVRRTLANSRLLYLTANMPDNHRRSHVKWDSLGGPRISYSKVPEGVSQVKLNLLRKKGDQFDKIPYERTSVNPEKDLDRHTIGFLIEKKLKPKEYRLATWYRNNSEFQNLINEYLEDSKERGIFDGDSIDKIKDQYLSGNSDDIRSIATITTIEIWAQGNMDPYTETDSVL